MKDTVRAYQYERNWLEVNRQAELGDDVQPGDVYSAKQYIDALLLALHAVNRALRDASKCSGSEFWDERGAIDGSLLMVERMEAHSIAAWDALREAKGKQSELPEVPPNEDAQHVLIQLTARFDWDFPGNGIGILDAKTGDVLFTAEYVACEKYDCEALAQAIVAKAPYVILEISQEE